MRFGAIIRMSTKDEIAIILLVRSLVDLRRDSAKLRRFIARRSGSLSQMTKNLGPRSEKIQSRDETDLRNAELSCAGGWFPVICNIGISAMSAQNHIVAHSAPNFFHYVG